MLYTHVLATGQHLAADMTFTYRTMLQASKVTFTATAHTTFPQGTLPLFRPVVHFLQEAKLNISL